MKFRKPTAPSIVLFLLCLMYFLTYVDRVNVGTAAVGPSGFKAEFKLSQPELGFVFAGFGWTYVLFQAVGGWISDRFGPRKTLFVCGSVWALATAFTGLATGLVSLMIFRLVLGLGESATFPTATRAMQGWTPVGRRGFAQGVTHSFARLGNAVTPPVVAALMIWLSWRGAFVILGCVSMVWVAIWWLYFRDDPRDHAGITEADLARLPPPSAPKIAAQTVPWGRLIVRMLPVTFTYFCYGWSLWLFLNWIPQFFADGYKLDVKKSALFSSGVFFAGVVGDALGGIISDYLFHRTGRVTFSRLAVILPGMLGAAACLIPVLFLRDVVPLALCLAGGFFFLELVIGPIWAVPMDIAPQYSGMASGLMNTGSALAAIVSPIVFGYVLKFSNNNYNLPFYGSVGLLLAGAVLAFTMRPDRKFVDEPAVVPPVARVL